MKSIEKYRVVSSTIIKARCDCRNKFLLILTSNYKTINEITNALLLCIIFSSILIFRVDLETNFAF